MLRRGIAPLLAVCFLGLAFAGSAQAAGGNVAAWGYAATGDLPLSEGPGGCFCVPVPGQLSGLSNVVQVAGGELQGLAVLDDGTVRAWGENDYGQLGDGTTIERDLPVPVPGLSNVVAVAGGENSSMALLADGTVRTWGANQQGVLGSGSTTGPEDCEKHACSRVPIPVPGVSNAIAIAMSVDHALALRADGTVLAWGNNQYGTLGDGIGTAGGCECVPSATQIPNLSGVVAVATGEAVGSALLADGTMRVWGYNFEGELGTGTQSTVAPCFCLPPTSPAGVSGVRQIAQGDLHTLAVLSSGGALGWGANDYGEVGLGTVSTTGCNCILSPTQIPGLAPQTVSAGYANSFALLPNGTGQSWGDGYYGQFGNGESGDKVMRATPGPVTGVNGASEIAGTETGAFAILGPSQTLKVELAGAGAGRVGGSNIVCPPSCSTPKPQGQTQFLRATPDPGTGFAGFTGPCTGTGPCQVKMTADQTVTATFGPPKGTTITKADIKNAKGKKGKGKATFSFSAPGVVTAYECQLIKPKAKRKKGKGKGKKKGKGVSKSAKKKPKAPKPKFAPCSTPQTYKHLRPGRYRFSVKALNSLGADANPATRKFTVKKAKPKKKHRG
jgi:alpha-tubulin suppressor-like RCC1 family protein